jgi:hypothetical protein
VCDMINNDDKIRVDHKIYYTCTLCMPTQLFKVEVILKNNS